MAPAHVARLRAVLGDEVHDAHQDTFLLYSQPMASHDLGFLDPRAASVDITVAGLDLSLRQSPAILSSDRPGGTTGAVLWKLGPLLAAWLAAPSNALVALLPPRPSVLELGCGISPLIALALRRRPATAPSHYVLSDQPYVAKLVAQNIAAGVGAGVGQAPPRMGPSDASEVCFRPLDWETDAVTHALAAPCRSFDAVLACDCVYNDALIAPFVQTCVDACRLRARDGDGDGDGGRPPCLCIIAQQLRDDQVFLAWLTAFHASFHVWQMPPHMLPQELRPTAGFVIHVGILRGR